MNDVRDAIDWRKTTFEGSRREQLRQAQRMTVRQRLEALDELTRLSERLQALRRQVNAPRVSMGAREQSGLAIGQMPLEATSYSKTHE